MRVTILGCGGSGGVPLIGDYWGSCNPNNPKNRRLRVSILVEEEETAILVDTSPDLRQQALAVGLKKLDAVLFTHAHADHLNGIDDLRPVNRLIDRPLDVYGSPETMREIKERFGYVFEPVHPGYGFYKPVLEPHEVTRPFSVGRVPVTPFEQDHGFTKTTGYRIGNIAYSTDVVDLPESSFATLEDLDLWIVDCLRFDAHPTHAHLDKALDWIARVRPKRAVLTHMNQSLDYDVVAARCPKGAEPAFDGMMIETG
jgi:phosphoribosyl 1,2-cyclic phosphate phosphodiesterase